MAETNKEVELSQEPLTKEQVAAVVEFAQGLMIAEQSNVWTPFMTNSLLQRLNNNPQAPSPDALRKALSDYLNSGDKLQEYTEFTKIYDFLFARVLAGYVNALSFDLQYTCCNAYKNEEYTSDEYIADKRRVEDFLTKFNYKKEFRQVVEQVMTHEVYFTWFRKQKWGNKDGMKYALQILPQDRCLLTGYWEHGLLFDFDMGYFLQAGVDIRGYDPVFIKYYKQVFGENGEKAQLYRPTNQFIDRKGTFATWTQTSPEDGAWCFKHNPANFNTTPFLASYMKSALTNDEVEQLQYDKNFASAYAILAGEIGLFDGAHSGEKANQFKIDPKTLGTFMGKAKAGLAKNIKLAAMPVENLKWSQFTNDNPEMYKTQLQTSASLGFPASRAIYADDRMSNSEIEAALTEVYSTMAPLYQQFNEFLNFYVNKLTKKYKFRFNFTGSNYQFERKARFENLMKLADKGIVLDPTAFASVLGMHPVDFEASLRASKHSGWLDEFSQLMVNANTASQDEGGRPRQEGSVNDSTERTREL